MAEDLCLASAVFFSFCGMVWLALAKQSHWAQLRARQPLTARRARGLHAQGFAALFVSMLLCLRADAASMAALVWMMTLSASALLVALTLAWRPSWLHWFLGS
jgi:hypothetical protein